MSASISLILCISGDFWKSSAVVANTLNNTGVKIQLLVYNKTANDLRAVALFNQMSSECITSNDFENEVSALNYLLSKATGEYIVVVPEDVLLSANWLIETYFDFKNYDQVGCLTIPLNRDVAYLQTSMALTKDFELTTILSSDDHEHYGIQFFSKTAMYLVGAYDENLSIKSAIKQYCYRIVMTGLKAFYSSGISCIALEDKTHQNKQEIEFYNKGLRAFNKLKNPFLQLYELSPTEEISYHELDLLANELSPNCQKFFSKQSGQFGLITKSLSSEHIVSINEFSQKYNYTYQITSIPEPNDHYLLSSVTVVFKR